MLAIQTAIVHDGGMELSAIRSHREHSPAVISSDRRRMTDEEAEAVLTLVRGGWLKFELVDHDVSAPR